MIVFASTSLANYGGFGGFGGYGGYGGIAGHGGIGGGSVVQQSSIYRQKYYGSNYISPGYGTLGGLNDCYDLYSHGYSQGYGI